jgi:hypothetical protein
VAQERCLRHLGHGIDLAYEFLADTSDIDRQRSRRLGYEVDGPVFQGVERDPGIPGCEARQHHDARRRLEHQPLHHA